MQTPGTGDTNLLGLTINDDLDNIDNLYDDDNGNDERNQN